MLELQKDPKVVAAVDAHLVPDEVVLWAAAQRGIGRRRMLMVATAFLFYLAASAALAKGNLITTLYVFAFFSFFLLFWLAEMLAQSFVATDRRVLFISLRRPYRWSYWNYSEMDVSLIQVGKGKNVIHLRHFFLRASGEPAWQSRGAIYPTYIEKVPEIEKVREVILAQIARKATPVDEPVKSSKPRGSRGPRPRIHGTRTG